MTRTILREPEVSEMTSIPRETLRYWRRVGRGPGWYRLGGKTVVYDLGAVNAWLDEQRVGHPGGGAA